MPHTISRHLMDYDLTQTGVIPAVQSATLSRYRLVIARPYRDVWVRDAAPTFTEGRRVYCGVVGPRFFETMGIPILRGRGVADQDTETSSSVVVINEAMARQFWPNEDPVGREITFDSSPEERPRQIVGIVGNVKQFVLIMDSQPQAYVSYLQLPPHTVPGWTESRVHKSLVIRTQSTSAALIENVRRVISGLAPDSPVFGVRAVEQTVSNSVRSRSVLSQLLGSLRQSR